MKLKIWLFPIIGMYLILISATSIKIDPKPVVAAYKYKASLPLSSNTIKGHKAELFSKVDKQSFF